MLIQKRVNKQRDLVLRRRFSSFSPFMDFRRNERLKAKKQLHKLIVRRKALLYDFGMFEINIWEMLNAS